MIEPMIPQSSNKYVSKPKRQVAIFALFIIFVLCYFYNCPVELDLGRYYEDAKSWNRNIGLFDIIKYYNKLEINFIYQTTLVIFDRSFLGPSFVTATVVTTYFWFIIKNYYNNEFVGKNSLWFYGLMGFPPFIYVLTISRTACAVVFFYFAVECFLKGNKKISCLLFVSAIYTHIISGMFIGFFFAAMLIDCFLNIKGEKIFNRLCFLLPPVAWIVSSMLLPKLMSSNFLYNFFSEFYRFETYLGDNYKSFAMGSYSLADKLMMGSYLLAGYVLLNLVSYYSAKRLLFMVFFVALCFAGGSNFILLERYMVASSLFYALYFSEMLTLSGQGQIILTKDKYKIIEILCCISFFSFMSNLFLARRDFF